QDQRTLDLSLPRRRQRGKDRRFPAARLTRHRRRQGVLPARFQRPGQTASKITLDGYQASHRAAKEALGEHSEGNQCEIRSSKYVNNLIEQDHRSIKLRLGPTRPQALSKS